MLNDVTFNNDISAYYDWNIILTKCSIPMPSPKTSTVNIKGMDGVLDLSEVLTGGISYNNRKISLTFEVLNDKNYSALITEIANYLHGEVVTISFEKDDLFFYKGRATINQHECNKRLGKIVIEIDAEPFKYDVNETIINSYVDGEKLLILHNKRKRLCPEITVEGNLTMTCNDITYELQEGTYQVVNFILEKNDNYVTVTGSGNIQFRYRQGAL